MKFFVMIPDKVFKNLKVETGDSRTPLEILKKVLVDKFDDYGAREHNIKIQEVLPRR